MHRPENDSAYIKLRIQSLIAATIAIGVPVFVGMPFVVALSPENFRQIQEQADIPFISDVYRLIDFYDLEKAPVPQIALILCVIVGMLAHSFSAAALDKISELD